MSEKKVIKSKKKTKQTYRFFIKNRGSVHDHKMYSTSNWADIENEKKKWYEIFDLLDILQTSLSTAATKKY